MAVTLMEVIGVALVTVGLWLAWPPLAIIVLGVSVLVLAQASGRGGSE